MAPLKTPGSDGYIACFYQAFRTLIDEKVNKVVLNFLNGEDMLVNYINFIYIVLNPKVKSPLAVSAFWPISLCNVLHKLL